MSLSSVITKSALSYFETSFKQTLLFSWSDGLKFVEYHQGNITRYFPVFVRAFSAMGHVKTNRLQRKIDYKNWLMDYNLGYFLQKIFEKLCLERNRTYLRRNIRAYLRAKLRLICLYL